MDLIRSVFSTLVAALSVVLLSGNLVHASQDAAPAEAAPAPLRVAVIGASASAGFGCVYREKREDGEYAASFRLIDMVRLACPELALVTSDMSSGFFFMAPVRNGSKAAARAREFKPDCVVALDFLFWYCYGDDAPEGGALKDESQRLAKLELGLKELEAFTVPLLVGDIPNMQRAVGRMLSPAQMPAAETLAKANARLAEWAKARANVRILPLAAMQESLSTANAITVGDKRLVGTKEAPLLQRDELHPSPQGLAGLACVVAEAMKDELKERAGDCPVEPEATIARAKTRLRKLERPASAEPPAKK